MSQLINLDEVARRLGGISRRTVYRLIADRCRCGRTRAPDCRRLHPTKVRGGRFVAETELERYLRAAERTSAA